MIKHCDIIRVDTTIDSEVGQRSWTHCNQPAAASSGRHSHRDPTELRVRLPNTPIACFSKQFASELRRDGTPCSIRSRFRHQRLPH